MGPYDPVSCPHQWDNFLFRMATEAITISMAKLMFLLLKDTLTWSPESLRSKMWLTVPLLAWSARLSINHISSTSHRFIDNKTDFFQIFKTSPEVITPLNAFISKSISLVFIYQNLCRIWERLHGFKIHPSKLKPKAGASWLLHAAELSWVSGSGHFGQMSFCSGLLHPANHIDPDPCRRLAKLWFCCQSLPLHPLFAALFFLMQVLPYYFCDPASTSCLSYATGWSQVWRGERKSLSFL